MEFKLTYDGQLLGASRSNTRARHKHEIRQAFHPQLKRFWELTPALGARTVDRPDTPAEKMHQGNPQYKMPLSEWWADRCTQFGYRFCPLVGEQSGMHCAVRILFLRPEPPGQVVQSGDIDGRIKTIFDALRMPHSVEELGGSTPRTNENPFYCLLEDDKLISNLTVETATMLEPIDGKYDVNDCRLVISVKIWLSQITFGNLDFMAY